MKRDSQGTMVKILKEWKESGTSLGDFAQKKGITKTKLQYWLRKLYPEQEQTSLFPGFIEISSDTCDNIQPENSSQLSGKLQLELTFPSGLCLKIFG